MKRIHIINKPTGMDALLNIDSDMYEGGWQLKAERMEVKRLRKFRQQLVS